jgi:hypothetical protein
MTFSAPTALPAQPAWPLHSMAVPLLVTPRVPAGEQNAPGCTVRRGAGFVVVAWGLGLW